MRAVAEAASSGSWRSAEQAHGEWYGIQSEHFALGTAFRVEDAEHMVTFDPPTVLALLDRLAAAEAKVARAEALAEEWRASVRRAIESGPPNTSATRARSGRQADLRAALDPTGGDQ